VIDQQTQPQPVQWQLTVDALDALVVMVGDSGRIVAANENARQAAATIGFADLLGAPIISLRGGEPWTTAIELARRATRASPAARSEITDAATGRTWEISAHYIPNQAGDSRLVMMDDITNVVALEANSRRNERVADLGRLVGNVAHEVRNPLFSMSATVDALEARMGTNPQITRYIDNLRRELKRITSLMHDLLEYGKPPILDAQVEPLNIALLEAISVAAPAAAVRNVTLHCDPTACRETALVDRGRIAQAIQNLIENAIQFSTPGGSVHVRLEGTDIDGERWLACTVDDDGPGFPTDVLPLVFEPFYTTRRGGTGLGLSIVQRIVEIHGGQAFAENRPEGGGRVSIRIPARGGDT
jgi:signal transduction histidine kinase